MADQAIGYDEGEQVAIEENGDGDGELDPIDDSGTLPEYTDRSEYDIQRNGGDPFGNIKTIEYSNGESIEILYDNEGNPSAIIDTASGTRLVSEDGKWYVETKNGGRSELQGSVSVNQSNGAIIATLDNGTTVTTMPDGRTVATDADGNVIGVSNPGHRTVNNDSSLGTPVYASGKYGNGELVQATDTYGATYLKSGDQWVRRNADGTLTPVNGTVRIDPYEGVVVEPTQ